MRRLILSVLGLLCIATPIWAQNDVEYRLGNGITIRGTLVVPKGVSKPPVALIIAGSGPTDRNGNSQQVNPNSLRNLARALDEAGIATLRYDKRGIAASAYPGMREESIRYTDFADDARELANLLHDDGRFSQVVIIGHSEGAHLAMLAARDNPNVSKVIAIAGPGRPLDEVIIEQIERDNPPQQIVDEVRGILAELKKGNRVDEVPQYLSMLFRPSVQPFLISQIATDPAADIAALSIPVLLVQGGTDIQIKKMDMERLKEAYPKAQTLYIEDMNHILKRCSDATLRGQQMLYSNPFASNHPDLAPGIVKFITAN